MNTRDDIALAALLPVGMTDVLPPDAGFEASVVEGLMNSFAGGGYDRVKPPLMEFEETLFRGPGAATANHAFRLMDPESRRMVAVRADMTPQIARIATSRLENTPRPLRLSYAGQILRVRGSQLRGARQFGQVGAELIGSDSRVADVEIVLMAAEALNAIGVRGLTIDLCLSTLVPAVCRDFGITDAACGRLAPALDRKDAAAIQALRNVLGERETDLFARLLAATGEARVALDRLAGLELGPGACRERDDLKRVAGGIMDAAPNLNVTIDPVERRGWEYHAGVSFTIFAHGVRGELGAGGRYRTGDDANPARREHATGLTLFTDTLLQALGPSREQPRVFVPFGTARTHARQLQQDGWVTIAGLEPLQDSRAEAGRLRCSHLFVDGKAVAVD